MKKNVLIIAVVVVVIALAAGLLIFFSTKSEEKQAGGEVICSDITCLAHHFSLCTRAEMSMGSIEYPITVSIHGLENEKCHFTMVFGNMTAANCYFKKEDLNEKVLGQMFGNNEGQDAVLAEACGIS